MRSTSITSEAIPIPDEPTEEEHGLSLQLRGMTDVSFFPSLDANKEAQPWFNNMSIGGLYHLSRHQALGVEIGQEYLPMYREGSTRDDHIAWVTGLYLLQGDPIAILGGVRPFVQGGLGTSESGPVGKGIIGLSYAPETRVDLAIGAEGTAFLYHLDGAWYSARKAGITYMMRVHF
jgi:hypothetical protein